MSDIRARVFSQSRGIELYTWGSSEPVAVMRVQHWHLQVTKGDVVIDEDDCADFGKLLADAEERVIRYRGMQSRGVRLRPWRELVDEVNL